MTREAEKKKQQQMKMKKIRNDAETSKERISFNSPYAILNKLRLPKRFVFNLSFSSPGLIVLLFTRHFVVNFCSLLLFFFGAILQERLYRKY